MNIVDKIHAHPLRSPENVYTLYIEAIRKQMARSKQPSKKASEKRGKKNRKDSQLVIRLNRELRDCFVELCEELDTSAARELRTFMKEFVRKHDD